MPWNNPVIAACIAAMPIFPVRPLKELIDAQSVHQVYATAIFSYEFFLFVTLWSYCGLKHVMWQRVFLGASEFNHFAIYVRWLFGWRYI